ncbi:MAG: adenylate/guanylate cyclase domain-containing protein [Candidatus Electrothrix sp. GW3-4]|uniref:adenylate/guanylate cyclase domain-containing protein n=1 Tax=Candidatus Electrothrix sp. GW3-4 TaxID=3126740 RepID=UPI0030CC2525
MNKQTDTKTTGFLICFSFILSHVCFWLLPNLFQSWNLKAVDHLFQYRIKNERFSPQYNDTIVHVDLNDTSIQDFDNYYLDRTYYSRVIENLSRMGVQSQLHDFLFVAPTDQDKDKKLIEAVTKADNVYFGMAFRFNETGQRSHISVKSPAAQYLDETSYSVKTKGDLSQVYRGNNPISTFPALAKAAKGIGFLNIVNDIDGVFRRAPLLVQYKQDFYPSLVFRAVCDLLNVSPQDIIITPGKSIRLKNAKKASGSPPRDIVIPIDASGKMLINFVGTWEKMKHYNFSDIYYSSEYSGEIDMWTDELSGKIIIVSDVTSGSSDIGATPIDANFPLSGLHANTIHTILTESFLYEVSPQHMLAIMFGISIIMYLLCILIPSIWFALGAVLLGIGYIFTASFLFLSKQIILNMINPPFMIILSIVLVLSYRFFQDEKEKEVLRRTFEAYFSPAIVKKAMNNPDLLVSNGNKKELTILFSDIVSFTSHSANMAPEKVQQLLNEYFSEMTKIVFKHNGTVDKFIGDGMMVFFGDPEPMKDHALKCVQVAIEMQEKTTELRDAWTRKGDMPLEIRIGVNTGKVFVGNMGSPQRLSYTALGGAVNMAQRLESNAPVNGILISQHTNDLIKAHFKTKCLGKIMLKGFKDPVPVFEVKKQRAESMHQGA